MTAERKAQPRRAAVVTAAFVAVAAAILAVQVLIPPIVGVANNGDFEKVLGYAGLDYFSDKYEDRYQTHIVREFRFREVWYRSGYVTSETLLAIAARQLAKPLSPAGRFDIRVLGALHSVLFLIGLGTMLWAAGRLGTPAQLTAATLLTFFFTDVGYVQYFNSFYSQTASLLFFLLMVGLSALAIRQSKLEGWLLTALVLAAVAFVGSKPQESIHGPLVALWLLRLAGMSAYGWRKTRGFLLALGLCAFSIWYYRATPGWLIRKVALYQTVFSEMLPTSADPAKDLRALGLDPALARYSGTNAYMPGSPVQEDWFEKAYFDRIGYRTILLFYAMRPGRFLERLDRAARIGGLELRPADMGNLEKTDPRYRPGAMTDEWTSWTKLRRRLAPFATPALGLFLLGNLTAATLAWRRARGPARLLWEGIAFLVGIATLEFLVCALADGIGSAARHLFVFHAACDLLLAADAAWLVAAATRRLRADRPGPRRRLTRAWTERVPSDADDGRLSRCSSS
jgi:hypothetical protein